MEENARLRQEVERLRNEALTDPLTGLPNRRSLDALLAAEISRALRSRAPLAVMCIDVDNFKRVNDTWGHQKGDEVLVWVARFLRSQIRGHDIAGRLGGDEFVVVLPGTDKAGADILADRLRATLEQLRGGMDHPVGLSVGVAALDLASKDVTPEGLLERADNAMYRQKGRTKRMARVPR
ncbi:MAG: GGDEF domain-containing protein [Myxococcota bacterium]